MNKQELIDDFINRQKGIPNASMFSIFGHEFDVDYFKKRARELGWCNGYKYGVEYETNGKKPDLPDDVRFKVTGKMIGGNAYQNEFTVNECDWRDAITFCITDKRYKPVELKEDKLTSHSNTPNIEQRKSIPEGCIRTLMSVYFGGTDEVFKPLPFTVPAGKVLRCYLEDADSKSVENERDMSKQVFIEAPMFKGLPNEKSWHEKGELPPVGTKCEWLHNGKWFDVEITYLSDWIICFGRILNGEFVELAKDSYTDSIKKSFRPLKTERERFVEAAFESLTIDNSDLAYKICQDLYDNGFLKAPESTT